MIGGLDHDLTRPEVSSEILRRIRWGEFSAVWLATPCSSYSIAHEPNLRPRSQPRGVKPMPPEWARYIDKHNALADLTAEVIVACHEARV